MVDKIRWGIIGTGNIAHQFARGLPFSETGELVAVGSRTQQSADTFGDEFGVPNRHATYEALANDADVDAVYVSTPHPFHCANTILCLNAGKAVLCEKPFAMNVGETDEMITAARKNKAFLLEAMWTRFVPAMGKIRELIGQGAIGEVRMLHADFGYRARFDATSRAFAPELGGGAILDVGVYPISLASMLFGEPERIVSAGHLGETGVDEQNAIIFGYGEGQMALLSSALRTTTPQEVVIMGTDGMIRIPYQWWKPQKFTLLRAGKDAETFELPFKGNGYEYEADEVGRGVQAGRLESPILPLAETRSIMQMMDTIRAQWGLVYPME